MKTAQLHPSRVAFRVVALMAAVAMASTGCASARQRTHAPTQAAAGTDCFEPGGCAGHEAPLPGSSAVAPVPPSRPFHGAWSYATHCGFGHYVALDLVENEGRVTGSWSDGTNVRGSQGELKGDVRDGRLHVEWCGEGEEAGGHPQCPQYGDDSDFFERRGDSLVWFRSSGTEATEYVVLQPAGRPATPVERCDDEQH